MSLGKYFEYIYMLKYNDITTTNKEEEFISNKKYSCLTITTSSLDSANDNIQFYCYQKGKNIYFTDDGYYLNNFYFQDYLTTEIQDKIKHYGLKLSKNKELILKDKSKNFALSKKIFNHAILNILKEIEKK